MTDVIRPTRSDGTPADNHTDDRPHALANDEQGRPVFVKTGEPERPKSVLRPEIQALRAVAVLVVVVYHLWPGTLTGGFVGVDVFFVISGFLITAHLLREADRTGRISLPRFWARRIRRLLPASLTVLAASAAGVVILVPQMYWAQFFKEIAASAVYAQNWVLAASSIDYLAAENVASPVQHFWSLSVEEQFYLVWPILIGAVVVIAHRLGKTTRRWLVFAALAAVAAASFYFSVNYTQSNPGEAYFATTTRAWEFAAGGLLAVVGTATLRAASPVRTLVAYAGWVGIAYAVVTYSGATPFPGSAAAVPVLATLAVIWAGAPSSALSPNRLMGTPPVQFVGAVSYSVYLWHWPLIVFFTFVFTELEDSTRIAIIVASIALAWLTTVLIESPARNRKTLVGRKPRWTLLAMVLAVALVAVPAVLGARAMVDQAAADTARAATAVASADECFGAAAFAVPEGACDGVEYETLTPSAAFAADDEAEVYTNGCYSDLVTPDLNTCVVGDAASDVRVALIGDSHAASWYPALKTIAEENSWSLSPFMKSACPMSTATKQDDAAETERSCSTWNDSLAEELAAQAEPFDVVVLAHSASGDGKYDSDAAAIEGFREAWAPLVESGTPVVVMRDIPQLTEETNLCVAETSGEDGACDVPESDALNGDLLVEAAEGEEGVTVVDMNDFFCRDGSCTPVVGGVVAYRDSHHVTATYAVTMAPYLDERLLGAVPALAAR
ncbi:peptidoglycan/LPS O-acetylase OafA/YrhL [Conyzicola lurida]|uniref:Peptidoglycan/LPS O-acetylase OafA/YrhL n=1 Tax=Conyzicola lurida TaxID=1172621 RepID=A0A841AJP9_9MICO|nr:acyltransferase family protein [Conyzicola lurida]MBB5842558.1 peptidoglycan/LPS O-acetylase OafA/YrhL [Conyzicola lurida]